MQLNHPVAPLSHGGPLDADESRLRAALVQAPSDPDLHAAMVSVLLARSALDRAALHAQRAFEHGGPSGRLVHGFTTDVARLLLPPVPAVVRGMAALLQRDDVDGEVLARSAAMVCRQERAWSAWRAAETWDEFARVSTEHPLLASMLTRAVVVDPEIEEVLGRLRAAALRARDSGARVVEGHRWLFTALAVQGLLNEYAWAQEAADLPLVERLLASLAERPRADDVVLALGWLPPGADGRLATAVARLEDPALDELRRLFVAEPAEEALLARGMAQHGMSSDAVSRAVRAQYEENPYPRWLSLPAPPPTTLDAWLHRWFPRLHVPGWAAAPAILVAGCGTGRHALMLGRRFPSSRVLGVDLSLASLGYARRKALQAQLLNVDFHQGDILRFRGMRPSFHVVESVGVLHHMARPAEGLAALRDVVVPGGLVCLGLYSRHARVGVHAVRELAAQHGLRPIPADIRRARTMVRGLPVEHPAHPLVTSPDFCSTSGCRDLLFHAQEHVMDARGVAELVAGAGLEFVGFEPPTPGAAAEFDARFPEDVHRARWQNWDAMEREDAGLFGGMYVAWCRRPVT